jgi:hypothetical protein
LNICFFTFLYEGRGLSYDGEIDLGLGVTIHVGFLTLSCTLFVITGFVFHAWWPQKERSIANLFIFKPIDIVSSSSEYFLGVIFLSALGLLSSVFVKEKGLMKNINYFLVCCCLIMMIIEGANDYDTILYHNIGHNYWAGAV